MLEGDVKLSNVNKDVMIRKIYFWKPLSLFRLFLQRFRCGASQVTSPKFTDFTSKDMICRLFLNISLIIKPCLITKSGVLD